MSGLLQTSSGRSFQSSTGLRIADLGLRGPTVQGLGCRTSGPDIIASI